VTLSHQEIFQRYIYAGAITRNPPAVAALFTEDGVYEAPLESLRLEGREAIESGVVAIQQRPDPEGTMNTTASRSTLHETADPDVFIVEMDIVFDQGDASVTVPLVQIFRVQGEQIRSLRDYFKA
jgi:limonene-1,2-epoxide hydrolase